MSKSTILVNLFVVNKVENAKLNILLSFSDVHCQYIVIILRELSTQQKGHFIEICDQIEMQRSDSDNTECMRLMHHVEEFEGQPKSGTPPFSLVDLLSESAVNRLLTQCVPRV